MKKMDKILLSLLGIISAIVVLIGGLVGSYVSAPPADISLGAIPGNEVQGSEFTVGGLKNFENTIAVSATTSVICSFYNPYGTSTLEYASAVITRGIVGNNLVGLGTSSNAYGTSAPALIFEHTIPGGLNDKIVWRPNAGTSTSANANVLRALGNNVITGESSDYIIGPNQYLNFKIATSSDPSSVPTAFYRGSCSAKFHRI